MYDDLFTRIIAASRNNSLTFFVGAGVSKLSGVPSWAELINDINTVLGQKPQKNYSFDDNLRIAQMLYYHLNQDEDAYYSFIEKRLTSTPVEPNEVHEELLKYNPSSIITTNFDDLLEDAASLYCQFYRSISCDSEVPQIDGDRFILKVHGDLRHRNIVFKEEDYLNYSENFKLIETILKAIFSTNTVVFIGYSLNDYNIKLILNWAKTLLKGEFNQPIFIYTGSEKLSLEELSYQESKGLHVVEYYKACDYSSDYLTRYLSILKAIRRSADYSYEGKTAEEAFSVTYNLLEPLDRLDALRISDVRAKLQNNVHINDEGTIISDPSKSLAIKEFFRINKLSAAEFKSLPSQEQTKYKLIKRVFVKARIASTEGDFFPTPFANAPIPLGDSKCIEFNYKSMSTYVSKDYKSLKKQYIKAYYLVRLYKYEESFLLFTDISRKAFRSSDYMLFYLAEVNRRNLYKIIENIGRIHRVFNTKRNEKLAPWDDDNLFEKMPISFQDQFSSIANLYSSDLLYQYSYYAFAEGEKLQKALDSGTIEFGLTSAAKVLSMIYQYLHFFLGNHLVMDVFTEYKSTTKRMMELLLRKYSYQDSLILHEQFFPSRGERITFDKVDFYCFLECFDSEELLRTLNKYHIDTLEFTSSKDVETIVRNIVDYYMLATKHISDNIDLIELQKLIKTCLVLLRHIDISQELVEYLCEFILDNDFREIRIDDKLFFLHSQIFKRKKASAKTKKIIEDKLMWYLDAKIKAEKEGTVFEEYSATSGVNFEKLVHYISPDNKKYHSRKLSLRVSTIISENITPLFKQIVDDYWAFLSTYQRYQVVRWAKRIIKSSFNFDYLLLLVQCNARIDEEIILLLKQHLNSTIEQRHTPINTSGAVKFYPVDDPYEELNQVGYWCLINVLPRVFSEYLGLSDRFDFYYLYQSFDFSKFDPAWLLHLHPRAIKAISKNKTVKDKIRKKIAILLSTQKLELNDEKRIRDILIENFC